jgi:quinohemoprotein ethanol dehydrogenase
MRAISVLLGALFVPGHLAAQTDLGPAAKVDGSYIRNNELSSKEWPTIGLDYAETRHSKLTQINDANVKELGLAWCYNLESTRGIEATPVVVEGVMYVTASWSIVHAIDVRTGKRVWVYDPKVPREIGYTVRAAAMSSIAASLYPGARSSSAPMTAG